MINQQ